MKPTFRVTITVQQENDDGFGSTNGASICNEEIRKVPLLDLAPMLAELKRLQAAPERTC
jgi:hypothetical protein